MVRHKGLSWSDYICIGSSCEKEKKESRDNSLMMLLQMTSSVKACISLMFQIQGTEPGTSLISVIARRTLWGFFCCSLAVRTLATSCIQLRSV